MENIDQKTVDAFGCEWEAFDQSKLSETESQYIFDQYFKLFPLDQLANSAGIDIGCGSGRWAKHISKKVKKLYCLDASQKAIDVAKKNLLAQHNVEFMVSSVSQISLPDNSLDFAYSLGVLHHTPDTAAGIQSCVKKLKQNAPFLVYLYYAFDNKPRWFYYIWKFSNYGRLLISKFPTKLKILLTSMIAGVIYFPLTRFSLLLEKLGVKVENIPLSAYRKNSFYTMRTDALDRFGTRLEQRFTKQEIVTMLEVAGLKNIQVSDEPPYWTAIGFKG